LMKLGKYEEAERDLTHFIQNATDKKAIATALFNRGMTYNFLNRLDEAIEDFDRSIDMDSTNPKIYFERGLSLLAKNRYEDALKDFSRILELGVENEFIYSNRAYAHRMVGNYQLCIEEGIKIEPERSSDTLAEGSRLHGFEGLRISHRRSEPIYRDETRSSRGILLSGHGLSRISTIRPSPPELSKGFELESIFEIHYESSRRVSGSEASDEMKECHSSTSTMTYCEYSATSSFLFPEFFFTMKRTCSVSF
jgi:tetratricopeptide (TPR) repeat protein